MILRFKVMVIQGTSFKAMRDGTINKRSAVKQDLVSRSAIDRELFYTVCLEID